LYLTHTAGSEARTAENPSLYLQSMQACTLYANNEGIAFA
jgi:hypothetical protein